MFNPILLNFYLKWLFISEFLWFSWDFPDFFLTKDPSFFDLCFNLGQLRGRGQEMVFSGFFRALKIGLDSKCQDSILPDSKMRQAGIRNKILMRNFSYWVIQPRRTESMNPIQTSSNLPVHLHNLGKNSFHVDAEFDNSPMFYTFYPYLYLTFKNYCYLDISET